MAGFVELTQKGKDFITNVCSNASDNELLYGKSSYKINDISDKNYNPNGVLPYCIPETLSTKYWTCKPKNSSGNVITTNEELGEMLIKWFNLYSKQYDLDANIIAAQSYVESGYVLWNYPLTSSASGIGQFISSAVFEIIISNNDKSFTTSEIGLLTKNMTGDLSDINSFVVSNTQGRKNRPFLHQNICDNPQIMIKAQCSYMNRIAKRTDGIASSTLFGYSRGPGYVYPSYTKSIKNTVNKKNESYVTEGINYVERIFNILGNPKYIYFKNLKKYGYFGYDQLNITDTFNSFNAEIEEGKLQLL